MLIFTTSLWLLIRRFQSGGKSSYCAVITLSVVLRGIPSITFLSSITTIALFISVTKHTLSFTTLSNSTNDDYRYGICLVFAIAVSIAGIAGWETYTTPGVVFYGIALCLVFVIPIGIIKAMTGIEVTLNVLAEFIGGAWVAGNALAMNYFKSYGYVTCATALRFSNDLKLAHYVKIPPRHTFFAQMIATLVSTFVCIGVLNFQSTIEDVCQPDQVRHKFIQVSNSTDSQKRRTTTPALELQPSLLPPSYGEPLVHTRSSAKEVNTPLSLWVSQSVSSCPSSSTTRKRSSPAKPGCARSTPSF